MGSINRYIFRSTLNAFLVVLGSLTAVIWVTQALHDFDIMTSQGQTILVFIGITGMIIPLLVMVIAPIAFLIAMAHVLNKMSTNSEIIVMNAAGMSPWLLFRSFLAAALVVALLVAAISAYFAPKGLRTLRDWLTEVRANVVTTVLQPGRFTSLENGVTIHVRQRRASGQLAGIFLDDQRDPKERLTVVAEAGDLVDNKKGTFLVLENGTVQRHEAGQRDPAIVSFDRYAFDLSQFAGGPQAITYSIRERYLWQLMFPDRNDKAYRKEPGEFRAELFDRLMAPLYPIGFAVIAFAYLGAPRTNRQSRAMSILGTVTWVALLRLSGFVSTVFGASYPLLLSLQFIAMAVALGGGYFVIRRGVILEPPAFINDGFAVITERILKRLAVSS